MSHGRIQGWAERGGQTVVTDGRTSVTKIQASFPGATVTVFDGGTVNPSTIFSDDIGTPKSNPFIADTDGHWDFFADPGLYDVKFSGAGISSPFTIFGLEPITATGLSDPGSNGMLARTSIGVTAARTIMGTASAIVVTNGDGSGNPIINLDANLNLAGKTLSGGTFVSPGIANFQNAIHNHEGNSGGGQLNATNVFSAGTVPIPRLPAMVGATGVAAGAAGLVPQPQAGDDSKFLRGDGSWQTAGGGSGNPGGANTTLQYNNAGVFGGVGGATSDGTNVTFGNDNLRATSPRITTDIADSNGNAVLGVTPVGSAVNNFQVANAATGGHPVWSVVGPDSDINVVITPKGAGIIDTSGNFRITNNAPQITLVDANDTKTVRMSVSGANWDFTNDTLGSVPIRIITTNNNVSMAGDLSLSGNLVISNTAPQIAFIDTNDSKSMRIALNNTNWNFINDTLVQNFLSIDTTTNVGTFSQIPVLPGSNPTTDNQSARKGYVDSKTNWSAGWIIADPSTFPLNSFNLCQKIIISGSVTRIRDIQLIFSTGTASGSFEVQVRKHPFNDQTTQTTLGTLTINPGTLGVGTSVDISDHTFTNGDYLYIILTARSSPLQRDVSITVTGDRLG